MRLNFSSDLRNTVVAFDLDDTLAAEALFTLSGIDHISKKLSESIPALDPMRIRGRMQAALFSHQNHYSALEGLLDSLGLSDAVDMKETVECMRSHRPDSALYHLPPSTAAMLRDLNDRGAILALITDGRSVTQRNKIEALGLYDFFLPDNIFISGETGHDKTHPDNFLALQSRYPEALCMIYAGDNPHKDFLHPRLLGWRTFRVAPFPLAFNCKGATPEGTIEIPSVASLSEFLPGCRI